MFFLKIFVDWMMSSITHDALCVIVARYLLVMIHIQMLFTGLLSIIHINDYTAIQMDKNALKSKKDLEDLGHMFCMSIFI